MNNQDYVSYDTAMKLKYAGYPQDDREKAYDTDEMLNAHLDEIDGESYAAPHLWDALKWLREDNSLLVGATKEREGYCFDLLDLGDLCYVSGFPNRDIHHKTYELAVDNGIAAACEYLIDCRIHEQFRL